MSHSRLNEERGSGPEIQPIGPLASRPAAVGGASTIRRLDDTYGTWYIGAFKPTEELAGMTVTADVSAQPHSPS